MSTSSSLASSSVSDASAPPTTALSVCILGATPLTRYSDHLGAGFQRLGWRVQTDGDRDPAAPLLLQIHGAPHSARDDARLLAWAHSHLCQETQLQPLVSMPRRRTVVLIHRPDEVQEEPLAAALTHFLTELAHIAPGRAALAFLGDLHLDDPFFSQHAHIERRVVPHGFFDCRLPVGHAAVAVAADSSNSSSHDPHPGIVVGTHTVWGEMRRIDHVLRLLLAIFRLTASAAAASTISGLLGGLPSEDLDAAAVRARIARLAPDLVDNIDLIDHCHARDPSVAVSPPRHRIYLCAGATESTFIEPLFNTQLYHLHGAVRTGESSGSVHTRACVPVIFEMNGAERVERLEVVRVPYANAADADSALFDSAAERIVALANGGECARMLARNADRAAALSAEVVAARYAAIFEELAR